MHYWGDGGEAIRRIKAGDVVTPYILQVTKDCDDDGDGDGGGDHADDSHNHDDDNDRGDDHHNALVT